MWRTRKLFIDSQVFFHIFCFIKEEGLFQHQKTTKNTSGNYNEFSNISDKKEFQINYHKNFFSKLSENFIKFYKTEDISNNLNNYIDFNRKFKKWDLINQAIIISILSELSFTVKEKTKIVLNDYLNVAKNFVPINEVKMINAVVDKYLNDKQIL